MADGCHVSESGSVGLVLAAGYFHSLALKSDGSIFGWGANWYGQATPPEGDDFVAIKGGEFSACIPFSLAEDIGNFFD